MAYSRINLVTGLALGAVLLAQTPAWAASSTGRPLTSIRFGYALTLPPGWQLTQGDCAPYAAALSGDKASSLEIHVTSGVLSDPSLRQAELKALHAGGQLRGPISYGTLHLRIATYRITTAMVLAKGVTHALLVAGVVRNQHTYMLLDSVRSPAGRAGPPNVKAGRDILASLTFFKPARSFICVGNGVSQPLVTAHTAATATHTPTPHASRTPTRTPTQRRTSTATVTPERATNTPSATATPLPSSTATLTATLSPSGTPTLSPTSTVTWTPTPSWTPIPSSTPTATPSATLSPAPTWTASPTWTPTPGGIPTTGSTDNGCAITPDQAAGEAHLLTLLNADRAAAGVAPLTLLTALSVGSRDHSCDMGQHNNLSHTGSDGSDPGQRMRATGTTFNYAGENIGVAFGYGITGGIDIVDQQMMAEPLAEGTHHWNIVNAVYHRVGIGIVNLSGTVWITEDFVD